MRPAIFLDRDGTLIPDPGFLGDPDQVSLLPGVVAGLDRLQHTHLLAVVTNQSGIGRGILTTAQVESIHARVAELLAIHGIRIESWAYCPHSPEQNCECRKPGTGLHRRLAAELGIDLAASWCIGDRISDLTPARAFGARAILLGTGDGPANTPAALDQGFQVADNLIRVAELILEAERNDAGSNQRPNQ